MPENSVAVLKQSKAVYIRSFAGIADGIWLTGAIPRVSGEDCGGNFFREVQCRTGDTVPEEQALLTAEGTLITGCCHAGIINTLQYCREQHPEIPVRTIVGGLHLRHASAARLEKTAEFLRQTEVQEMYLFHCTGDNAVAELQKYLPGCKISSPVVGESWITP
jgi:7,8-dihydropterin-6-yl-methyl-4-(beta-D-ribofuranosyl)aminobenzene 5'-phosphate synthase